MSEGNRADPPSHAQQLAHEARPLLSRPRSPAGERPEHEAREAEECFRALAEAARDYSVCQLDLQGQVAYWCSGAERLHGYQPEELLGQPFVRLFAAKDFGQRGPAHWLIIAQAEGRFEEEHWCVRKDGSSFRAHVVLTALRGEAGHLRGFSLVIRNVTELRRAEELVVLRDRALGTVTQGVFLMDASRPENPIVYANPALERMTAHAPADLLGQSADFFVDPDSNPLTLAEIEAALWEARAWSGEVLLHGKDGAARWHELSLVPAPDTGGRVAHFVGVLTDVTQRKRREEQFLQMQRIEVVARLASGIAHDLNNMLTAIFGWCNILLLSCRPGDPLSDGLEQIRQAAEIGASLTRRLFAFSRAQAPRPQALDLAAVVADVERLLRRLLGENIELVVAAESGLSKVRADRAQIEQVLFNLTLNARDAMPQGGRLTIELANAALGPVPYVCLTVTDTGCGMSEEVLGRIFEPFFTTKEPGKGTGLGLFTVKEIVERSGGQIRVSNRPGQGTRFEIYLPRSEEGAPPEPLGGTPAPPSTS